MTFVWLIVWLCSGSPSHHFVGSGWFIALLVCLALDVGVGSSAT